MGYKIRESVSIIGSTGFMSHSTAIPIHPFIGLCVGALTVQRVFVNQGRESDDIEVEYEPVTEDHAELLGYRGWTREGVE